MPNADVTIIGGGIVGLATAFRLTERTPDLRVAVLEKEQGLARHQTGRNSGVLHSGVYYQPGSLKALNCRRGRRLLGAFCDRENLPYEICGKVIVAADASETPALERIRERGRANDVACELIDPARLRELEPHAAGVGALHVPEAGIVDFAAVCGRFAEIVQDRGGTIQTRCRVTGITKRGDEVVVRTTRGDMTTRRAINCAGLHSDRLARRAGAALKERIVPFRGEYYELTPPARRLCRNLIYPAPDPRLPFLGVHFTRRIGGGVECGPNAVPALAREGYSWRDVDAGDVLDMLSYRGFRRLVRRHWRAGVAEIRRSLSKRAFVRALQRLVPAIQADDLRPSPAGVRAQALSPSGDLVDDFLIRAVGRVVHVCNAPSPAATSCLSIADHVIDVLTETDAAGVRGRRAQDDP